MVRVDVYGAVGCHLCDEAQELLARLAPELGLEVTAIDITGNPDLEARFRPEIPVVFVDGRKAYKYRVDERDLRRRVERLRRAGASAARPPQLLVQRLRAVPRGDAVPRRARAAVRGARRGARRALGRRLLGKGARVPRGRSAPARTRARLPHPPRSPEASAAALRHLQIS